MPQPFTWPTGTPTAPQVTSFLISEFHLSHEGDAVKMGEGGGGGCICPPYHINPLLCSSSGSLLYCYI